MGVLSSLVIAGRAEAEAVARSDVPSQNWEGIDCKGLDNVKLGTLWAILEGVQLSHDNVMRRIDQIETVAQLSEHGPWVYGIPRPLRDLLSELAGEEADAIQEKARNWATTDELRDWDNLEVETLLQDIADLADTAKLLGQDLLLWMSL